MKNNKKGFTLIELLIVIGIIAILAAAIIIAINPGEQFKQARNATRWSHMNSIANGVYSYVISHGGNYPDCILDYPATTTVSSCKVDLVDGGHIGGIPEDPSTGENYVIQFGTSNQTTIKISSTAAEATGVVVIQ
ncbi:MAG TPA: prepilin-type N-terminal cleavage/methylation domain-containing protein [Candidatus Pacearchaeota archaeon]|jgi:prepilin-type N-terminal cleavage/methylation domain-containing protein|nr:prepilin-type N-terminal cleavage/methylation domain-containing protein [Candidatus Pacearchaeota archaeon]